MTTETHQIHVRFTLDAIVDTNGESHQTLASHLERSMDQAVGNGAITGSSAAEVSEYSSAVRVLENEAVNLTEDELATYFSTQIENGSMELERIPVMMARLALRDPADVRVEMAERMQMLNDEHAGHQAAPAASLIAPPRP